MDKKEQLEWTRASIKAYNGLQRTNTDLTGFVALKLGVDRKKAERLIREVETSPQKSG